jgi:hypothetical protein
LSISYIQNDDKLKFLTKLISFSVVMKLGGRCPLVICDDRETFLRMEIEYTCKKSLLLSDRDSIRKEFCTNICKNIMC